MFESDDEKMAKFQNRLSIALDNPIIQKKILSILESYRQDMLTESPISGKYIEKKNAKDDIEKFKDEQSRYIEEVKTLQNDLSQACEKIDVLEKKLGDKQKDNQRLKEEIRNNNAIKEKSNIIINDWRNRCEGYSKTVATLQNENNSLKKQNGELMQITDEFAEPLEYYKYYQSLPTNTQKRYKTIINDKTLLHFLLSAGNKENVLAFWDDLKYRIDEIGGKEIIVLIKLLRFFLTLVNINYSKPVYVLMENEKGKSFDEERHIRSINCSKYQGFVERVLLPGIWNDSKQEAERKTVVEY